MAQLGGWTFLAGEGGVTPAAVIGLVALGAVHLGVCYLAVRQRLDPRSSFVFLLLTALTVRLIATAIPVSYSDDLYRYRWEGRWQSLGGNPYRTAPNDAEARRREPPGEERVPGRDFGAVYGPLLLLNERIAYQVAGENIGWWRAPAALADLGALALLAWWIRLKGWPRERLLIYAASPLPVLEFWSSGHHDAWLRRRSWRTRSNPRAG